MAAAALGQLSLTAVEIVWLHDSTQQLAGNTSMTLLLLVTECPIGLGLAKETRKWEEREARLVKRVK